MDAPHGADRSLHHKAGLPQLSSQLHGLRRFCPGPAPARHDPPSMGSVCEYLNTRSGPDELPDYVYMPNWLGWGQAFRRGGPYGGFLGKRYDAFTTECSPSMDPGQTPVGVSRRPSAACRSCRTAPCRRNDDRSLQPPQRSAAADRRRGPPFGNSGVVERYSETQQRAFGLLGASKLVDAFDLRKEPPQVVERYGNTLFGNTALTARRLVERGVRFVNVTFDLYERPVLIDLRRLGHARQKLQHPQREQAAGLRPGLLGVARGPRGAGDAGRDAGRGDERDGPARPRSTAPPAATMDVLLRQHVGRGRRQGRGRRGRVRCYGCYVKDRPVSTTSYAPRFISPGHRPGDARPRQLEPSAAGRQGSGANPRAVGLTGCSARQAFPRFLDALFLMPHAASAQKP